MTICNKDRRYILQSSKFRTTLFAFENNAPRPSYVIKVYDRLERPRLDILCGIFEKIRSCDSEVLKNSVPRILDRGEDDGNYVVYEEFIDKASMEVHAKDRSLSWEKYFFTDVALASEWIARFHRYFLDADIVITADKISFLLGRVGEFLKRSFPDVPVEERRLPLVVAHRDFFPTNVLTGRDGLTVIDWDRFQPKGLPLFDLLQFVLGYMHARHNLQMAKIDLDRDVFLRYLNMFYVTKGSVSGKVHEAVDHYCGIVGLDKKQRDTLLLLWIYNMLYVEEKNAFFAELGLGQDNISG